jgi:hypothetical protein
MSKAYNSIVPTAHEKEAVKESYNKSLNSKKDFASRLYKKVSKVIKNPVKWARILRGQMSKDTLPFVTMNQLLMQNDIAYRENDMDRAGKIEELINEMVNQELEDGFPGTLELALEFLKKHVSIGRMYAAKIESVYCQYVVNYSTDPFIHIPKVVEARKVAEKFAAEGFEDTRPALEIYQHLDDMIQYVLEMEIKAGETGTEEELLEALHSTAA